MFFYPFCYPKFARRRRLATRHDIYSHLSNKRGAHGYRFWEIPPSSKKNPPSAFIDSLDFSTLHSSFIRFYVLVFSKKSSLHVYSSLRV